MRLFQLARQPRTAIRIALLGLLLALGLSAVAHANHHHDDFAGAATVLHAKACGYCSTFGAIADAPRSKAAAIWAFALSFAAVGFVTVQFASRFASSAQPRAPPRD